MPAVVIIHALDTIIHLIVSKFRSAAAMTASVYIPEAVHLLFIHTIAFNIYIYVVKLSTCNQVKSVC